MSKIFIKYDTNNFENFGKSRLTTILQKIIIEVTKFSVSFVYSVLLTGGYTVASPAIAEFSSNE
jgi:hypothetical protein